MMLLALGALTHSYAAVPSHRWLDREDEEVILTLDDKSAVVGLLDETDGNVVSVVIVTGERIVVEKNRVERLYPVTYPRALRQRAHALRWGAGFTLGTFAVLGVVYANSGVFTECSSCYVFSGVTAAGSIGSFVGAHFMTQRSKAFARKVNPHWMVAPTFRRNEVGLHLAARF